MKSTTTPNRDVGSSDSSAVVVDARTAQLVRRVFVPHNPNKMRAACPEVVQAARDFIAAEAAPLTRLELQAIYDALCFTSEHAGCVSDAHNTVADKIKALLPNDKLRHSAPAETEGMKP